MVECASHLLLASIADCTFYRNGSLLNVCINQQHETPVAEERSIQESCSGDPIHPQSSTLCSGKARKVPKRSLPLSRENDLPPRPCVAELCKISKGVSNSISKLGIFWRKMFHNSGVEKKFTINSSIAPEQHRRFPSRCASQSHKSAIMVNFSCDNW